MAGRGVSNPLLRDNASSLLLEHRRLLRQAADQVAQGHPDGILDTLRDLWRHGDEWEAEADRLARHLAEATA